MMGQQPSQQMLPEHTGLKALYWRTQKQQLLQQQQSGQMNQPKAPQAWAGVARAVHTARARRIGSSSFFMARESLPVPGRQSPSPS
jgi:hypothetical protein